MAEDIRTTRTKARIKKAFLELLTYETYEHITVSDIAARAEVNRVTFYTHYIDKACLLSDVMEDQRKKYLSTALEYLEKFNDKNEMIKYAIALTTALLDVAMTNKDIILVLGNKENGVIFKLLEEQTSSFVISILTKLNSIVPLKYPANHVASFLVPAFLALVTTYVNEPNGMPLEEFRKNLQELTENIVSSYIFTENPNK